MTDLRDQIRAARPLLDAIEAGGRLEELHGKRLLWRATTTIFFASLEMYRVVMPNGQIVTAAEPRQDWYCMGCEEFCGDAQCDEGACPMCGEDMHNMRSGHGPEPEAPEPTFTIGEVEDRVEAWLESHRPRTTKNGYECGATDTITRLIRDLRDHGFAAHAAKGGE